MFNSRGGSGPSSVLRVLVLAALACATAFCAEPAKESTSNPPKVMAVLQLTHDGVSKTSLIAGDDDLFVTESPASGRVVSKLSLRNAEQVVVPAGFADAQVMDISADHAKLLVSHQGTAGEGELWAVPIKSGTPQRLGDSTGHYATWSRDNKHLAFVKGSAIFVANGDGNDAREVYTANGSVFALHFSPDGKRLRFSVGTTVQNTTEIWEVRVNGQHAHALLDGWQRASSA